MPDLLGHRSTSGRYVATPSPLDVVAPPMLDSEKGEREVRRWLSGKTRENCDITWEDEREMRSAALDGLEGEGELRRQWARPQRVVCQTHFIFFCRDETRSNIDGYRQSCTYLILATGRHIASIHQHLLVIIFQIPKVAFRSITLQTIWSKSPNSTLMPPRQKQLNIILIIMLGQIAAIIFLVVREILNLSYVAVEANNQREHHLFFPPSRP